MRFDKTIRSRTRFDRVVQKRGREADITRRAARAGTGARIQRLDGAQARLTRAAEESTHALGQFEEMVDALLDAYRTGTPAAMERHWAHTWHRRSFQAMRTYVQLDLGRQAGAADLDDDITIDDARFLVAREHGFERWDALVKHCMSLPGQSSLVTNKPIRVFTGGAVDGELPSWHSRDWGAVVARVNERDAAGVDGQGQMTDAMLEEVSRFEHITTLNSTDVEA